MPISTNQWRASVGSNNATRSRSHAIKMSSGSQLLTFMLQSVWTHNKKEAFTMTSDLCDMATPTTRSTAHKRTRIVAIISMLCIGLSIAMATCILSCSGDVETNPGPGFDLIPDNLGKVLDLIINAQTKWLYLGLALNIKMSRLEVIEQDRNDVSSRFREMLHTWLKMVDPSPSWEGLIVALEKESVGCDDVAKVVRQTLGVPKPTCDSATTITSAGEPGDGSNVIVPSLSSVQMDTKQLEEEFSDIANRTSDIIRGVDVAIFRSRLVNLHVRQRKQHREFLDDVWPKISNASFEDVWFRLVMYWDFLNYTLLEHIVKNFGDQAVKESMEYYKLKLKDFRCKTRLCDFAKYFQDVNECLVEKDLKKLVVKLNKNWQNCTLQDMENWKESLTQKLLMPTFVMILKDISSGSVIITWAIPAVFIMSLVEKLKTLRMTDFYKEHRILSLTFNSVEYQGAPISEDPHASVIASTVSHSDIDSLMSISDSSHGQSIPGVSVTMRGSRRKVPHSHSSFDSGFLTPSVFGQTTKSSLVSHSSVGAKYESPKLKAKCKQDLEVELQKVVVNVIKGPLGFGFLLGLSQIGPVVKHIVDHPRCGQLSEGDVLMEVNGENVQNYMYTEVVNMLKQCPSGTNTEVIVLRHLPQEEGEELFDILEVYLTRQASGFGFRIIGGRDVGLQVTVGAIFSGGAADIDGHLHIGDEITHINDHSVIDASLHNAIILMSQAAALGEVALEIRRKIPLPMTSGVTAEDSIVSDKQQKQKSGAIEPAAVANVTELSQVPRGTRKVVINRPNIKARFGFVLQSNSQRPGCIICRLMPDGPSYQSGKLYINDKLLAVNGTDVSSMEHEEIVRLIKDSSTQIELIIQQRLRTWTLPATI